MMRVVVCAAWVLSAVVPMEQPAASAESWTKVAHTGSIDWCTDTDTVSRKGSKVEYWLRPCDYDPSRDFAPVQQYRVDCKQDFSSKIVMERRAAGDPWKAWPGTPVSTSAGQSARAICSSTI